jgi:hypothetical protein
MIRGEGKWQGRRPLLGGEGADGDAARCGGTPAFKCEAAAAC